ncbi:Molybdopterin synthase catalytic subunit [Botrimarina colliarenosi]|uniref:Molybdopterin synthase catalytic subunit n=1 Tax=Botrimarina colliarenosi TaxID=2528001 RepID=A0A5C6AGJ0_9BACT|nr:molybdenum cofactor biosynthesis protein MoaE [Botrimarina colliarenosi]TWT98181.1 Molybdopterin synthase catalytic subunit [Botrimarina colliarenosi]
MTERVRSQLVEVHLVDGALAPKATPPPVGAGAWLVFEGIVRPSEEGRPLAALDYEAYEPMTSRELRRLAEATRVEHGLLSIVVEHSVGRVAAGEVSFRLAIGSKHRAEGIRAAETFIDRMKKTVPLWKTPVYQRENG